MTVILSICISAKPKVCSLVKSYLFVGNYHVIVGKVLFFLSFLLLNGVSLPKSRCL